MKTQTTSSTPKPGVLCYLSCVILLLLAGLAACGDATSPTLPAAVAATPAATAAASPSTRPITAIFCDPACPRPTDPPGSPATTAKPTTQPVTERSPLTTGVPTVAVTYGTCYVGPCPTPIPPCTVGPCGVPQTPRSTPVPTTSNNKPVTGKVGQVLEQNGHTLTVNKLERTGTLEGQTAGEGQEFVLAEVTLQSGSSVNLGLGMQLNPPLLMDNQLKLYPSFTQATKSPRLGENAGSLNKGDKTRGWLTFQLPQDTKGLVLVFMVYPQSIALSRENRTIFYVSLENPAPALPAPLPAKPVGVSGGVTQLVGSGPYLFSVRRVERSAQVQTNRLIKAHDGNEIVAVELYLQNNSAVGTEFELSSFTIKDTESFKYNAIYKAQKQPDLEAFPSQVFFPAGSQTQGWLLFEVPRNATGLVLNWQPSNGTSLQVILSQ